LDDNRGCTNIPTYVDSLDVYPTVGHLVDAIAAVGTAGDYGYRASSVHGVPSVPTLSATVIPLRWCESPTPLPVTYQWRREGVPLVDGPTATGSIIQGANTSELYVLDARNGDEGMYDVVVTGDCQTVASSPINLEICEGDFDGSHFRTPGDLFLFLELYFSGDRRADLNEANGLSVQDIFDFLAAFFWPFVC
jgi:hypothetical protein